MNEIKQAMLEVFQDPLYKQMTLLTQARFNNAIIVMDELEKLYPVMAVKSRIFDTLQESSNDFQWRNMRGEGRCLIRESERYSDAANS